jgi:biotin carboxyl carrier protein
MADEPPVTTGMRRLAVLRAGDVGALDCMVVAPSVGVFRALPPLTYTTEGEIVTAGQLVGVVESGDEAIPVESRSPGFVMDWFARDGEYVQQGEPVARLRTFPI